MAKKEKKDRFIIKTANSEFLSTTYILIDKETGVNYLYHTAGNSGGLTPLLDSTGKVIVTSVYDGMEDE